MDMSTQPEPIIIDRRHPAWVASYAKALNHEPSIDGAIDFADLAYLRVRERDQAQIAAISAHRAETRAAHQSDVNQLAVEWHNKLFGSLTQVEKDEIRAEITRREFEGHKSAVAKRDSDLNDLALAMYGEAYSGLPLDVKATVGYTYAAHDEDVKSAIAAQAEGYDPLAEVPA